MKDIGVYYAAGPISMMHIDAKEIESGYRFPKNYKELLAQNDFLRPKLDLFKFYRNGSQDERDVNFFGYLNDDVSTSPSRMGDYRFETDYLPNHIVPFGYSANGDYICFDYRYDPTTTEPHVVLMYHDDYVVDKEGNTKMAVNFVAPNFEAFVDMLYEPDDEED